MKKRYLSILIMVPFVLVGFVGALVWLALTAGFIAGAALFHSIVEGTE